MIINNGMGSKIIREAKQLGIPGASLTLARGTLNSRVLSFLGLSDVRKEVIFMVADRLTAYKALEKIVDDFKMDKPNNGIAFTTSIRRVYGTTSMICDKSENENERGANDIMYHAITIIVDRGKAEKVIEAATKAGSKGGTIMNGRGSGIHETSTLFSMEIEPQKEIVLILSEREQTEKIVSSIRTEFNIDEPGMGIIYVQDVNRAYGLYR